MKDYYAILGVVSSAEDVVIRAAYRALAQRYHPDRYSGDPARMAEINEAYNILSDAEKRKAYDHSRGSKEGNFGDWVHEEEADEKSYTIDPLDKDWKIAVKFYPDLTEINERLSKISHLLAFTYRAGLLDLKAFNDRRELARAVESQFLQTYFGNNPEIVDFARQLIFDGSKAAAKALNDAIRVLGNANPANLIIGTICNEFNVETTEMKKRRLWKEAQERQKKESWANTARMLASKQIKITAEEQEQMLHFEITFDGENFLYKQFKYEKLPYAINYAKLASL